MGFWLYHQSGDEASETPEDEIEPDGAPLETAVYLIAETAPDMSRKRTLDAERFHLGRVYELEPEVIADIVFGALMLRYIMLL